MNTLLLRLAAPLQSWGVQSHFTVRDSGLEPSKSGVIGLICAALGRPRTAPLDDLAALRMGVRVDREGVLRCDYHIAQDVLDAKGKGIKASLPSNRYYLSGAAFLVGLEGENLALLEQIQQAILHPVWTIYLGRKAFVPTPPVCLRTGLKLGEGLEQALSNCGWITRSPQRKTTHKLRAVIETLDGAQIRPDVPISLSTRQFSGRRVSTFMLDAPEFVEEDVP